MTERSLSRRKCPYSLCSRLITTTPTVPSPNWHRGVGGEHDGRDLIPQHEIMNNLLDGPCPASLMYYPLDNASTVHLSKRAFTDMARMHNAQEYQRARDEAPFKPSDNRSQSARQPGRVGREPPPDSPDWVLGGRADEDVQSTFGNDDLGVPLPDHVEGHSEGRQQPDTIWGGQANNGGNVGIQENAALIRAMQAKASEAHLVLGEVLDGHVRLMGVIEQIEEAKGSIHLLVGGDEPGPTLADALNALEVAREAVQRLATTMNGAWVAPRALVLAREKGEEFIARLYS